MTEVQEIKQDLIEQRRSCMAVSTLPILDPD
jgi:hypothetical protein